MLCLGQEEQSEIMLGMYLRSAHFVEGNKNGCVQETAEGQVFVIHPWRYQQQGKLRQECCQA